MDRTYFDENIKNKYEKALADGPYPFTDKNVYALLSITRDMEDFENENFKTVRTVYMHSLRVAALSESIGQKMKLPEADIATLKYASFVHDIGKINIPDDILYKRGKLEPEEMKIMNMHSYYTGQILDEFFTSVPKDIYQTAVYHHIGKNQEKIDLLRLNSEKYSEDNICMNIIAYVDKAEAIYSRDRTYRREQMSLDDAKVLTDKMASSETTADILVWGRELFDDIKAANLLLEDQNIDVSLFDRAIQDRVDISNRELTGTESIEDKTFLINEAKLENGLGALERKRDKQQLQVLFQDDDDGEKIR